jgi:DNA-binding CsgD family transcriptional regulator
VRQFDDTLRCVRSGLGDATLATILDSRRNADSATVIAEALERASRSSSTSMATVPPVKAITGLTACEFDVLRLLAQGHPNCEIAKALFIGPLAAATHVKRLRANIDVSTRTAATAYAH